MFPVAAAARSTTGKGIARKTRLAGKVPAVVYGSEAHASPIAVDPGLLVDTFRKAGNRNTIVHVELEGQQVPCLVREVQRHPVTREILHVDFYRLTPGQPVHVTVPLRMTGKSKAAALGGRAVLSRRDVKAECEWESIPTAIDIDVTELDVGGTLRVSDLVCPPGVKVPFRQNFQIVNVIGKLRAEEPVAGAPVAGAAAAKPGAAAAKPAAKAPAKK